MSSSSAKRTPSYFCFFGAALLGLGWAQYVSDSSQKGDVNVPSNASLMSTGAISTIKPTLNRQRVTANCWSPPQPANGAWQLDRFSCGDITNCDILAGTELRPGSQLYYRCNRGYRIEGNGDVYCRGRGKLTSLPKCVEIRCASLNSVSTMVSCTLYGKWVNCDSPVLPNTRAEVSCRRGYKKDTGFITSRRSVVNCEDNGEWNPDPIRCVPVCGLAITHQQPFVTGGTPANVGDFPWHATLYQEVSSRTGKEKVFICGATIIHTNLVLTAAHCVYDETYRMKQDPSKLFVVTGNVFRDYDSPLHDPQVVRKATVKNVYTHCQYYGLTGNYASDVALLELHEPFVVSSILLPACMDDSEYQDQFLEPGAIGRVAGFGRTATGVSSGNLQTLTLPYVSFSQCKTSKNAAQNEAFISSDKFCAGYNNGSAVCEGDSGGGLVFRKGDLWYVMGIVSVGLGVDITTGERTCEKFSYSLYTKVSSYMSWIQDVLINVERNETYPACINEAIDTQSTQHVTSNGVSGCLVPPQPANGEWKLHQNSCQGIKDCRVSEGAVLQPGSQLVYSCIFGLKMKGMPNVVCSLGGNWTSIPTCTGDSCSMKNGSTGVCILIKSCEPALQRLIAGGGPENTCGFVGREPIVCCPIATGPATDIPSGIGTTVSPVADDLVGDGRGVIARQKCTEYSSVDASSCPVIMTVFQKPVTGSPGGTGKVRASPMEFPHMVAVGFNLENGTIGWLCGGTLVSKNFVLTAAHCANSQTFGAAVWVRVGDLNLKRSDDGATPQDRRIAQRIVYPQYKAALAYHDIALLHLESRVPFNDWIRPACLYTAPSTGLPEAVATGWGNIHWYDNEGSDDLMKVTLPIVSQTSCNTSYTSGSEDIKLPNGIVPEWMICAGALGRDTCQGDTGGPLVIRSEEEHCMYDLIGITNLGRICGVGLPGIYTRVYYYIPWIESVVWGRG